MFIKVKIHLLNLLSHLKPKAMLPLSSEERQFHLKSNICHICKKALQTERVADHYHNILHRTPNFSSSYLFHNLSEYDCHLFIKAIYVML